MRILLALVASLFLFACTAEQVPDCGGTFHAHESLATEKAPANQLVTHLASTLAALLEKTS